jgi:hypothetical protein
MMNDSSLPHALVHAACMNPDQLVEDLAFFRTKAPTQDNTGTELNAAASISALLRIPAIVSFGDSVDELVHVRESLLKNLQQRGADLCG